MVHLTHHSLAFAIPGPLQSVRRLSSQIQVRFFLTRINELWSMDRWTMSFTHHSFMCKQTSKERTLVGDACPQRALFNPIHPDVPHTRFFLFVGYGDVVTPGCELHGPCSCATFTNCLEQDGSLCVMRCALECPRPFISLPRSYVQFHPPNLPCLLALRR